MVAPIPKNTGRAAYRMAEAARAEHVKLGLSLGL
jgi:hypothetical protein